MTDAGDRIEKEAPATIVGDGPSEAYRGMADSDETMPERMRRLRREYPRRSENGSDGEADAGNEA